MTKIQPNKMNYIELRACDWLHYLKNFGHFEHTRNFDDFSNFIKRFTVGSNDVNIKMREISILPNADSEKLKFGDILRRN